MVVKILGEEVIDGVVGGSDTGDRVSVKSFDVASVSSIQSVKSADTELVDTEIAIYGQEDGRDLTFRQNLLPNVEEPTEKEAQPSP